MTLQQISIFPQRALFENGTLCQCIQSKRTHGQRQCSNNKTLIENIMNMNKYDTFRMRYQTRIECCNVITSNATMDWNHCGSDQYTEMMGFISRTREILDWQSWDGNNMCVLCAVCCVLRQWRRQSHVCRDDDESPVTLTVIIQCGRRTRWAHIWCTHPTSAVPMCTIYARRVASDCVRRRRMAMIMAKIGDWFIYLYI